MKKSFFKKIMILCFAVFGMVMIGNNVFATDPNDGEEPGDGDSGGGKHANPCHSIWDVTYTIGWPPSASCSTGGVYKCTPLCPW
jgi:hypothetical protein